MPNMTVIESFAFYGCNVLSMVSLPNISDIGSNAFVGCYNLASVYVLTSSVPTLGINAFSYTPLSTSTYLGTFGSIYVPSSLYTSFTTATNWSVYSARMVSV